jgi:hypothetical protein
MCLLLLLLLLLLTKKNRMLLLCNACDWSQFMLDHNWHLMLLHSQLSRAGDETVSA